MNGFAKKILGVLAVWILVCQAGVWAEEAQLNGINIQKSGDKVSLKLDVEKSTQAKVQKKPDGSMVIQLPKTKLPKAYEEYGMPNINQNGVSASVQTKGDTVEITVPNASNVEVKLSSGKTVKAAQSSKTVSSKAAAVSKSVTPNTKTAKTVSTSKPKVVVATKKPAVKPVVRPKVASKPKTVVAVQKPPVAPKKTINTPVSSNQKALDPNLIKKAAGVAEAVKTQPSKPKTNVSDEIESEVLNLDDVSPTSKAVKSSDAGDETLVQQNPKESADVSPEVNDTEALPNLTLEQENNPADALVAPEVPQDDKLQALLETYVYAPLSQFQAATASMLGPNWMNEWGFLALAAVGGLLIAFVILSALIKLLLGGSKKQGKAAAKPKKVKQPKVQKAQEEDSLELLQQDEFVASGAPIEMDGMAANEQQVAPPPMANRFENYLQPELQDNFQNESPVRYQEDAIKSVEVAPQGGTKVLSNTHLRRNHRFSANAIPEQLKTQDSATDETNARFVALMKKKSS